MLHRTVQSVVFLCMSQASFYTKNRHFGLLLSMALAEKIINFLSLIHALKNSTDL